MPRYLAALSLKQAFSELKSWNVDAEGFTSVWDYGRKGLQAALQEYLQGERWNYLGEQRKQGVADRANGYYRRRVLTTMGDLALRIPRTRTASFQCLVDRYSRRQDCVDRLILSCFILGQSTRKVGESLKTILGAHVSASTVSRVARALDQVVTAFHRRPLPDRYRALLLDGVVLSTRTGAGALRRPVLTALGILPDGRKEILDFRVATSESEANWLAFLTDLQQRGLAGKQLEIVVVDGGRGLLNALPLVFPRVPVQRCWAHKVRNVLDKMPKRVREEAKMGLRKIYGAQGIRDARSAAQRFARKWTDYPAAVSCLRRDLPELLIFFRFSDPDLRRAFRTTNAIERRFREVRRRTRPMGAFADRTSLERILYAVFTYENRKMGTVAPFLLTHNS